MANQDLSIAIQDTRMAIALLLRSDIGRDSLLVRRASVKGALTLAVNALKSFVLLPAKNIGYEPSSRGGAHAGSLADIAAFFYVRRADSELNTYICSLIVNDASELTEPRLGFFVHIEESFGISLAEWQGDDTRRSQDDSLIATSAMRKPAHWAALSPDACLEQLHILQRCLNEASALWVEY